MIGHSASILELIDAFKRLPGVGNKSATRMAYHLLERDRDGGTLISDKLRKAIEVVRYCQSCRLLTDQDICHICADPRRDKQVLCIVGAPADVFAIEQSGSFKGRYFVLMGNLSPLDGIGPNELQLPLLFEQIAAGNYQEVILATNTTVEGEGTANYIINELAHLPVQVSRIAYGVPLGGELEYVDGSTLGHAFSGRKTVSAK